MAAGQFWPTIGPELSCGAVPEMVRDWPVPPWPQFTLPMVTQSAMMTSPCPPRPPKNKQNPDTAHKRIKFNTTVLDSQDLAQVLGFFLLIPGQEKEQSSNKGKGLHLLAKSYLYDLINTVDLCFTFFDG